MKIKSWISTEHLQGFMNHLSSNHIDASPYRAKGECFYRSTALVIDAPAWDLCIGTLPGVSQEVFRADNCKSPTPFIHCWVEFNDSVVIPTMLEKDDFTLHPYLKTEYYDKNKVHDVHKIVGRRVRILAADNGWDSYFRTGNSFVGSPIVETLLAEAAVPYQISPRGGIVPPNTSMPPYAF